MGLTCSNTASQAPLTASSETSSPPQSAPLNRNSLDALRIKAQSAFHALVSPRALAMFGALLTMTGCATHHKHIGKITPLDGDLHPGMYEKTQDRRQVVPAGLFEEPEKGIKFYYPSIKLTSRVVVVCFCDKKCTRWPDKYSFGEGCGHKDKKGKSRGAIILLDRAFFESDLRQSKGGRKIQRVDESIKITPLPPYTSSAE